MVTTASSPADDFDPERIAQLEREQTQRWAAAVLDRQTKTDAEQAAFAEETERLLQGLLAE